MVDEFAAQLREAAEKIGVQEDEYAFELMEDQFKQVSWCSTSLMSKAPQINGGPGRSLHAAGTSDGKSPQMAEWWVDEPLELVYLVRMTSKGPQRQDLDNLRRGAGRREQPDLKDDRVSVISRLVGEHQKAKTTEQQTFKLIYPDK